MDKSFTGNAGAPAQAEPVRIGRVALVSGAHAAIELDGRAASQKHATVGKFMGLMTGKTVILALVTQISEQAVNVAASAPIFRKMARVDLIGEIKAAAAGMARFQRGITEHLKIGDSALLLDDRDLRLVFGTADADHAHIGDLQQNPNIGVHIDIEQLLSPHFAVLGATGVGKSSGLVIILHPAGAGGAVGLPAQ